MARQSTQRVENATESHLTRCQSHAITQRRRDAQDDILRGSCQVTLGGLFRGRVRADQHDAAAAAQAVRLYQRIDFSHGQDPAPDERHVSALGDSAGNTLSFDVQRRGGNHDCHGRHR
jgi:hypothetical protein